MAVLVPSDSGQNCTFRIVAVQNGTADWYELERWTMAIDTRDDERCKTDPSCQCIGGTIVPSSDDPDNPPYDRHVQCRCEWHSQGDRCEDYHMTHMVLVNVLIVLVVGAAAYIYKDWQAKRRGPDAHNFQRAISDAHEVGSLDGVAVETRAGGKVPLELPRREIKFIDRLGAGNFGDVMKATRDQSGTSALVAVKTVRAVNEREALVAEQDLVYEAVVMTLLPQHANIVKLHGVVTKGKPYLAVIDYCENGSLLSYLQHRLHSGTRLIATSRVEILRQISCGMAVITNAGFVHRDLAARNVLLDSHLTCKIADFGLARGNLQKSKSEDEGMYYRSVKGVLPLRWSAPEAVLHLKFSEKSDVWAFGIVWCEVFNDGELPYKGITNDRVQDQIIAGVLPHINLPHDVTLEYQNGLRQVWEHCLALEPEGRFSFKRAYLHMSALAPKPGTEQHFTRVQNFSSLQSHANDSTVAGTAFPSPRPAAMATVLDMSAGEEVVAAFDDSLGETMEDCSGHTGEALEDYSGHTGETMERTVFPVLHLGRIAPAGAMTSGQPSTRGRHSSHTVGPSEFYSDLAQHASVQPAASGTGTEEHGNSLPDPTFLSNSAQQTSAPSPCGADANTPLCVVGRLHDAGPYTGWHPQSPAEPTSTTSAQSARCSSSGSSGRSGGGGGGGGDDIAHSRYRLGGGDGGGISHSSYSIGDRTLDFGARAVDTIRSYIPYFDVKGSARGSGQSRSAGATTTTATAPSPTNRDGGRVGTESDGTRSLVTKSDGGSRSLGSARRVCPPIFPICVPHFRLYEVVSLHMCVFSYKYRNILEMLLKLMKLCELK